MLDAWGVRTRTMSMTAFSSFHPSEHRAQGLLAHRRPRFSRIFSTLLLAMLLVAAAQQVLLAMQSPGQVIRGDLKGAAEEARTLPINASQGEVRTAILSYFPGFAATAETAQFPAQVQVTLHGIDHRACLDAMILARRFEGRVVVELAGYRTPDQCGERNDMTWRIMP